MSNPEIEKAMRKMSALHAKDARIAAAAERYIRYRDQYLEYMHRIELITEETGLSEGGAATEKAYADLKAAVGEL